MNKFKNSMLCLLCFAGILTGCSTPHSISQTYDTETGEKVKLSLDKTGGYEMTAEMPFVILKDNEEILTGQFLPEDGYVFYEENLTEDVLTPQGGHIVEQGKLGNSEYICYTMSHEPYTEYNFFVKINDKTSVIIGSLADESVAKDCFHSLSFQIVN